MAWLGAFSQELQKLWLPKDDLRDMSSWTSPPLVLLRDIHSKLLAQYDCKEVCAPSQSQINVGACAGPSSQSQVNIGAGSRQSSQDGDSQLQESAPLTLPQVNLLVVESSCVRDESSVSNADVPVIPSQLKVTHQILRHWEPFRDLKSRLAGSRRAEQLSLCSQQSIVATVEDSVLRTEMDEEMLQQTAILCEGRDSLDQLHQCLEKMEGQMQQQAEAMVKRQEGLERRMDDFVTIFIT